MKPFDRHLPRLWCLGLRDGIPAALVFAAVASVALIAAGCGSSSNAPSASAQGGATSIQVLATVQRSDLVQSVVGSARLGTSNGKTVALVQVAQQNAASVAVGQKATVMVFRLRTGGQSGSPFPRPYQSGAPMPQPNQSGFPDGQNGQGGFDGGGFGGNGFRGRGTAGKVAAVTTNADGSATVTIALSKKPANASASSVGFASIQTKLLASNVMIIPTAAIKGSGSSATVQVLSGGKTSTVSVVVGQQSGGQSEIVSGLSVGQNVVYTRSFRRGGFPGNGNRPFPGQSGAPFGGQPGSESGGQSNGGSL